VKQAKAPHPGGCASKVRGIGRVGNKGARGAAVRYAIEAASELEEGGWPAFGRDLRHSGRDLQRGIEALMDQTTGVQQ
jgi:hypothetical protein